MSFQAVVFDMDGLLLDTEKICMACFFEASESIGYPVNRDVYMSCIGTNEAKTKSLLIAGHPDDFPYEQLNQLWRTQYRQRILDHPIPVKDGALELLKALSDAGIPIALATSTAHEHALVKLRNASLLDFFDYVIGGDQVARGKPAPEIYLKATSSLNVAPNDCIAFEDSENGVRSAISAGLKVFQVPDLVPVSDEVRALGHTILPSLSAFEW